MLDSLRFSEVAVFESLDVGPALPFPRKGIVAAGSFPKECHIRDPIPAAHANFGGGAGVAQEKRRRDWRLGQVPPRPLLLGG